jgi:hypothetical protein
MSSDIDSLIRENEHLKCVMREAARELLSFWDVHCPEGGLGPHRLLAALQGEIAVTAESNPYPQHLEEVRGVRG